MVVGPETLGLNYVEDITSGEATARGWPANVLARVGVSESGSSSMVFRSEFNPNGNTTIFNHEAGHALGLTTPHVPNDGHSSDIQNIMYPYVPRQGNEITVDQLRLITTHPANEVKTCSSEASSDRLC